MSFSPCDCRAMAGPERYDVLRLMRQFRPAEDRLGRALGLFVEREDLGFVWLAYREDVLVGCCSVSYGIGTAAGGLVAVVRDLYVEPAVRRTGVASALLDALEARLAGAELAGVAVFAGSGADLRAFLTARGLAPAGDSYATDG